MHCSAFAATGPATADGKIVFGHITMFGLYPSNFYNVWLDVKPAKGHRVLMQTLSRRHPERHGLLPERRRPARLRDDHRARRASTSTGMTVASRIRQALQYADTIDKAVEILEKDNNGLYTNEWLLADIKTNEIAMFELGTHKSKLWRSSKNEWFGGTEGFYWGCNNTKDLDVRLETIAERRRPAGQRGLPAVATATRRGCSCTTSTRARSTPTSARWPSPRRRSPPIHSLDAKFTTTDLAKELKSWALFGPPLGRTWQPTSRTSGSASRRSSRWSAIPWTILHAEPPAKCRRQRRSPSICPIATQDGHGDDKTNRGAC